MVRARETQADHQPLSLPPALASSFQVPPRLVNQLHSPVRFQVHLHTQLKNHGPSGFRNRKGCIHIPEKEREDLFPGVSYAMGKPAQATLAAFHSCRMPIPLGRLPLRHCPSQHRWMQFGRLQAKLGKQGEQLGPDWACELQFQKAVTGARWARCRQADKRKGARQIPTLSHSSGKPAIQTKQGLEYLLCTGHWEVEATPVLFMEPQICLGTEKWTGRKWDDQATVCPQTMRPLSVTGLAVSCGCPGSQMLSVSCQWLVWGYIKIHFHEILQKHF